MQPLLTAIAAILLFAGCRSSASVNKDEEPDFLVSGQSTRLDTLLPLAPYSELIYEKTEKLAAAPGTKSVLFNSTGSLLYAMNLEGMSIHEIDRQTRKTLRIFKFKPTRGTGWDYTTDKPIPSWEEKPVEACFSHNDSLLWVSLHNADGIVPIPTTGEMTDNRQPTTDEGEPETDASGEATFASYGKEATQPETRNKKQETRKAPTTKKLYIHTPGSDKKDSILVPLIRTGKTPKIISRTADSRYLLVSNWHSYNVSVLELDRSSYPFGKVIATLPVSSIPRGIAVDDRNRRSYVAIMGGSTIEVINNDTWEKEDTIQVTSNPRHLVLDSSGRIFVSYNKLATIACIDPVTGKTLFKASTHTQPRTIMLSKNQKFLFVTCYSGNMVDVFRIGEKGFTKVASLPCKGKPVGVDIFEDDKKLEAWVCSYTDGLLHVYTFRKK
jgi:DNA-binding beta-propeller fold protein YncE